MCLPFQRLESGIRMYTDADTVQFLPFNNFQKVSLKSSCKGLATVKPVLSGQSKMDKMKVLMTGGCLMQVKSIAGCSGGAFCNTFDLH